MLGLLVRNSSGPKLSSVLFCHPPQCNISPIDSRTAIATSPRQSNPFSGNASSRHTHIQPALRRQGRGQWATLVCHVLALVVATPVGGSSGTSMPGGPVAETLRSCHVHELHVGNRYSRVRMHGVTHTFVPAAIRVVLWVGLPHPIVCTMP